MTRLVAHVSLSLLVRTLTVDRSTKTRRLSMSQRGQHRGCLRWGRVLRLQTCPYHHCQKAFDWTTMQAEENSLDAGADGCNNVQEDVGGT